MEDADMVCWVIREIDNGGSKSPTGDHDSFGFSSIAC